MLSKYSINPVTSCFRSNVSGCEFVTSRTRILRMRAVLQKFPRAGQKFDAIMISRCS